MFSRSEELVEAQAHLPYEVVESPRDADVLEEELIQSLTRQ